MDQWFETRQRLLVMLGRAFSHNCSFAATKNKSLTRLKTLFIRSSHRNGETINYSKLSYTLMRTQDNQVLTIFNE